MQGLDREAIGGMRFINCGGEPDGCEVPQASMFVHNSQGGG